MPHALQQVAATICAMYAVWMRARAGKSTTWHGRNFRPCKSVASLLIQLLEGKKKKSRIFDEFSFVASKFLSVKSIHLPNSEVVKFLAALILCYAMSIAHNSLSHFSVAIDFESSINNRFHRYLITNSNKMAFTCTLRCMWWISFGWLRLNDLTNNMYRTYTHTHWF